MARTLKCMDVSPVLALVAADYLIAECGTPRPTEEDVVATIEEGVAEYGSASRFMDSMMTYFGKDYVPGKHVRAVAEHERLHAEEQAKADDRAKAQADIDSELNKVATVEFWGRTRGLVVTRPRRIRSIPAEIKYCNPNRSLTIWF